MRLKVGIIGFGNMGSAIAERIKKDYPVLVVDKDKAKTNGLKVITVVDRPLDLVCNSDIVIIAVKPQDIAGLLAEIKDVVCEKIVISIAAGITTSYIEGILAGVRLIRAMPNLPARIGQGITCICKGKRVLDRDLKQALRIFSFLGKVLVVKENMMNAVTAVSGSGPGFWAYLVEPLPQDDWVRYSHKEFCPQLKDAAKKLGFSHRYASILATATMRGCLAVVKSWKITPQQLKALVASKGGTTEAGLRVLEKGGTLVEAVQAACKRAEELSGG